jgi:DNA polymerase-4
MDCFFAAVEMRDFPELKGKPVAVGGSPNSRGVISTANYQARKFGVKSAISSAIAKKLCPGLIIKPSRFSAYIDESKKIHKIFKEFTQIIEPLSLDEAFLDISDRAESGLEIAKKIQDQIYQVTKLTASIGISYNKFLAKIASDWKKPNGIFEISQQAAPNFLQSLSVAKISGVGKVTNQKLESFGIKTCGDLRNRSKYELIQSFGKFGNRLFDFARGIDLRAVSSERTRKSISIEHTFSQDILETKEVIDNIEEIYKELHEKIIYKKIELNFKSILVKVKFSDFSIKTSSTTSDFSLISFQELVLKLINSGPSKPIRLLGLGVNLRTPPATQLTLPIKF